MSPKEGLAALFVCSLNRDRSVAAQLLAKRRVKELRLDWKIGSAGLEAEPGRTIADELNKILVDKYGIYGASNHQPLRLDSGILEEANLVLCFTKRQERKIKEIAASVSNASTKIYTLPEYSGFPAEEIRGPGEYIGRTPFSWAVHFLPWRIRRVIYGRLNYVDAGDLEAVDGVYVRMVERINTLTVLAVNRMMTEA